MSLGQGIRALEMVIKIRIQMVRLIGQHRAERPAAGREASISFVHIVAVGDLGGNGLIRIREDTSLNGRSIPPGRCGAVVVECAATLTNL